MTFECWSIIIIVCAICVIEVRTGRNNYALPVIPIVIVPAAHLLGMAFSTRLARLVGALRPMQWYLILMVVALALACGLIALLSQAILSKRTRNAHLILGIGFSVILALIFILDTISL